MRQRAQTPDVVRAPPDEDDAGLPPPEVQDRLKKTGLDYTDQHRLVQALHSGASWDEVKAGPGAHIRDRVLETWKAALYEQAEQLGRPVVPAKPTTKEGAR